MSYAVRKDGQGWRAVQSPADCSADEIWQALAPLPKAAPNPRIIQIKAALLEIDAKKVRAASDAILTGEKVRLQALEAQAQTLRLELAAL